MFNYRKYLDNINGALCLSENNKGSSYTLPIMLTSDSIEKEYSLSAILVLTSIGQMYGYERYSIDKQAYRYFLTYYKN